MERRENEGEVFDENSRIDFPLLSLSPKSNFENSCFYLSYNELSDAFPVISFISVCGFD